MTLAILQDLLWSDALIATRPRLALFTGNFEYESVE